MTDDLPFRRQLRCAQSPDGHDFDDGCCVNCGLIVVSAKEVS